MPLTQWLGRQALSRRAHRLEACLMSASSSMPRRVWCVSDLHSDHKDNLHLIERYATQSTAPSSHVSSSSPLAPQAITDTSNDALIVAGDVSDCTVTLLTTLALFKKRFRYVFFTPGNHDAWLPRVPSVPYPSHHSSTLDPASLGVDVERVRAREGQVNDSIGKIELLLEECERMGVFTSPHKFKAPCDDVEGDASNDDKPRTRCVRDLWICPLLSWYHTSFDREPDIDVATINSIIGSPLQSITDSTPKQPFPLKTSVNDFRRCKWPFYLLRQAGGQLSSTSQVMGLSDMVASTDLADDEAIARLVDSLNDQRDPYFHWEALG
eukprot:GHVN01088983.1.p2 GENE.GHVN01088983.1~~GHVN01088983.1.p2  ORF type:complete len:324 (+),score=83.26 GHVN01088983.1:3088-4059(+)